MILSLRHRLLLAVMLPTVVLALAIATLFVARSTQALEDSLGDRGLAIVSFLSPAAEYGVISGNRASLGSLLQAVLEQRDVLAAAVYDREGVPLAVSGRLQVLAAAHIDDIHAAQIVARANGRLHLAAPVLAAPMTIDDLALAAPAGPDNTLDNAIGWVHVELDAYPLEHAKRQLLLTTLALVLAGLALTAWLAARIARAVSAPVANLANALDGVARGRLDIAVPDDASVRELRVLQGGFNAMSRAIAEAHQNLQARVDEATAQLAHQALHDPLTGLQNRRAFEHALELSIRASRRAGDQDTLCFIDLDRFKIVNDSVGHAAGDELLRRIARLINTRVRTDDVICRIGGDEFALILRACGREEARRIAEHLREAIASLRFNWEGRHFTVGASIGLMHIDGSVQSAADVLVAADLACYAAKKSGRNRVIEHDSNAIAHPTHERSVPITVEHSVSTPTETTLDTIPYERLRLYRQAILPLQATNTRHWFEVLLRLHDADAQPTSIHDLITQLARNGAGLALDRWVADKACKHPAARADRAGDDALAGNEASYRMSLNVTDDTLTGGDDYLDHVARCRQQHALSHTRIAFEFPAVLADQRPLEAHAFVHGARARGFAIGLERLDGSSSAQLRLLRPDYVKISLKTLTEGFGMEAGCNVAQALCGMAAALAITTIATEVEDRLLLDSLKDYGFDFAQGYLLARPEPMDVAAPAT